MIDDQIRQLASLQDRPTPFLSLYIDTDRNDESQRARIRLFLKNEAQRIRAALEGNGHQHDAAIEKGIHQIESYVERTLDPETRGLAIFSCPGDDLFLPLQLPVPVQPELSIGSRPRLRQLTELRRLYPNTAVAMVDAKSARLFDLEFGRVLIELDLSDPDMPRRHDQGGWSQSNLQRHVQDHIDHHHKKVADILSKMVNQERVETVIISGQERNLANFRQFLPKRVEEKIAGTLHLDIRSSASDVIEACQRLIHAHRSVAHRDLLLTLEDFAKKNGRGALGLEAVIDAANQRKLDHLFLRRSAAARGWKCTHCAVLGYHIPLGCPACGRSVLTVDLIDELIASAQLENAAIDFVSEESMLDNYEGVGAILRF